MSKPVYCNLCCASEEDLSPLIGCVVVSLEDGADEDGEELTTIKLFNPLKSNFIRLTIYEDGKMYISDFEKE